MPSFGKGADTAESAAAAARVGRAQFLSIKEGEQHQVIIRLLTEHTNWISTDLHMGVPTKPAPKGYKGTWPSQMSAVCQNQSAFRLPGADGTPGTGDFEPGYGHCYIHEHLGEVMGNFGKPVSQVAPTVWALCVLREPVRQDGKIAGFRDKMEEWTDEKGNKVRVPMIRVLSQRWGNFFAPIKASAYIDEIVCHRDFLIRRKENDYEVTPLNPTESHKPGTPSWQVYTDALEKMKISLEDIIVEQSSPEYYGRFFDPRVKDAPASSKSNGKEAASGNAEVPPDDSAPGADGDSVVSEEEVDALRARLEKSVGAPAGPADSS